MKIIIGFLFKKTNKILIKYNFNDERFHRIVKQAPGPDTF